MKNKYIAVILSSTFIFFSCIRTKPKSNQKAILWEPLQNTSCQLKFKDRTVKAIYKLNIDQFNQLLVSADDLLNEEAIVINVPNDKGVFYKFKIEPNYDRPVEIIADFPELKIYHGKSESADLELIISPEGNLFKLNFMEKKLYITNHCSDNEQIYSIY